MALLVLNPYFIILSYSYMTEITFVACALLTCLCYVEGARGGDGRLDDRWFWAGSLFAALTFLTRQFGLALPLAALLWLVYARKLKWRSGIAVALLPCLAALAYFIWSSRFGTTFAGSVGERSYWNWSSRPPPGCGVRATSST